MNTGHLYPIHTGKDFPMKHWDLLLLRNPDGSLERIRVYGTFNDKSGFSGSGLVETNSPPAPRKIANRVTPFTGEWTPALPKTKYHRPVGGGK